MSCDKILPDTNGYEMDIGLENHRSWSWLQTSFNVVMSAERKVEKLRGDGKGGAVQTCAPYDLRVTKYDFQAEIRFYDFRTRSTISAPTKVRLCGRLCFSCSPPPPVVVG